MYIYIYVGGIRFFLEDLDGETANFLDVKIILRYLKSIVIKRRMRGNYDKEIRHSFNINPDHSCREFR